MAIAFIAGLFIGFIAGYFAAALMVAASKDE